MTGIFAAAIPDSRTLNVPLTGCARITTANGFIAVIVTRSARCAVSSSPLDVTNLTSMSRPQVS